VDKLPSAEKAKITDLIKPNLSKMEDQFAKLVWIPGVGDKIQPAVDGVLGKLASLGGLTVSKLSQVSANMSGTFSSLGDSLTSIKDTASAEAALPKVTELGAKLDAMKAQVDKLPSAEKAKITDLIKADLSKLEDQFAKLVWIPGVGDKIRPAVDGVLGKLASLGGLPVPKVSQVSADMAGTFSSLTSALAGIKDSASAEAALPKLKDIGDKLDGQKSALQGLPESGRSTILEQIKPALNKLKELVDKVLAMAGVGDKIKPVITAIMAKLTALAA
jgi:hypothetical protein